MPNEGVVAVAPGLAASVKLLDLASGLYSVIIGDAGERRCAVGDMALPITHVFPTTSGEGERAEIFAVGDSSGWAGPDGGTIVVKIPRSGGRVVITTYRPAEEESMPLSIQIAPLGQPAQFSGVSANGATGTRPSPDATPDTANEPGLATEVTLYIDGTGEVRLPGGDWIGTQGESRYIEAFAIRPLEGIEPGDVEYKAFGPNGRETPWVTDLKLCGSRGRGMALTGLAVRVTPNLRDKFDVLYEGSFFNSGISVVRRNGEPCRGTQADDPLEAVRIRLIEHA
jgi:hypothetical protein